MLRISYMVFLYVKDKLYGIFYMFMLRVCYKVYVKVIILGNNFK